MKKYVSKYYISGAAVSIALGIAIISAGAIYWIIGKDPEGCLLFILTVLLALFFASACVLSKKLFGYVIIEKDCITMYSFFRKELGKVDLNRDIFCENIIMYEGRFSKKQFVILSNIKFESYENNDKYKILPKDSGLTSLRKVNSAVIKNKNQIIMPYDYEIISKIKCLQNMIRIE